MDDEFINITTENVLMNTYVVLYGVKSFILE